jgi:FKBP-type peptidyl-prolyl cis-trans isomerase (trigger factor)
MYPNFELISAKEGQDWQIRATTAELPKFEVKGYKEKIRSKAKSASGGKKSTKKLSREEKEQLVIATLLEAYDVEPPTLLVENEVQSRLSALLERLEKLGLQLENYLLSIGKTIDTLREEYNSQASAGIKLDLILGKISADEKVEVSDKEIEDFIHASEGGKPEQSHAHTHTNEQKIIVRTMLKKRKILDSLASLL